MLHLIDTPGPRRLRLRGLPVARGVRGRGPARRREPGHPGPDAGQLLPGARAQPRGRRGAQQDRPARRGPRPLRARRSSACSASTPPTHPAHLGQDRRGGRRAAPRGDRARARAHGATRRPAARAHLRLVLRPVPRRRQLAARRRRARCAPARGCGSCRPTRCTTSRSSACARRCPSPIDALGPGEVGYLIAGIKDVGEARSGETVTDARAPADRGARGLPGPQADGLLRAVPDRRRRPAPAARRAREAEAQRRRRHLRAGELPRARLRVPLRVPRAPAHGDRARAPGARVRPLAHRDRAVGRLPRHAHRRLDRSRSTTPPTCPTRAASTTSTSRCSPRRCSCRSSTWARSWSCASSAAPR